MNKDRAPEELVSPESEEKIDVIDLTRFLCSLYEAIL
jgi:hypothetical protein